MALAVPSVASMAFQQVPILASQRVPSVRMSAELEKIAKAANPVVGYWDPLNLAKLNFWGKGDDATVGFLRHAEIKHGRVAMAAFVGYIVQSNGLKFPWAPFDAITATTPEEQWDALPVAAKLQIILFVGFLEVYSEHSFILEKQGEKHYMKGGKPGYFPKMDSWPHPVPLDLYDPFGFLSKDSAAKKEAGLIKEINNGRLAMIGIFGFICESKIPGSVPWGPHLPQYAGDVMQPFA